jgi:antitoxin component HigA of HigAB toxin-antitoxin module
MEKNNYNVISFQTKTYEENAKLYIDPKPDTVIRIFMTWYGSKKFVEV